jgi:hypothetical protein
MPTAAKSAPVKKRADQAVVRVLYLYAISQMPRRAVPALESEGIDGAAKLEALRCGRYLCWMSRVAKSEFAEDLSDRMQNLDWLAAASLRHQRAVSEISSKLPTLPARFGTVFLNEASLEKHIKVRGKAIERTFQRVADADEWGVKVFAVAAPRKVSGKPASSGAEYLKRKAEQLRPRASGKLEEEVVEFVFALKKIAVDDGAGGKASAGQPGLLWHGSFLVRRTDQNRFTAVLEKFAGRWRNLRRIDCTGPWPPYSFVGEHV